MSTRLYTAAIITYNLTVDDVHTYYVLAGRVGILVHNCGSAEPKAGSGKAYSVAYETKISEDTYPGRSRAAHFQAANRDLAAAMDSDQEFADSMEDLIPGIGDSLVGSRGGISRRSPSPLWTWHHAADDGLMQLVPRIQHESSGNLQNLFHPGGVGGFSIWG
ncbi:HNH endonuclease [Amycolatopsis sp. DSM 110486]|nr:HNH endonuclease [Amycolatopsis sp. DSM 110486]